MTIVSSLKLIEINKTPSFYLRGYGMQILSHGVLRGVLTLSIFTIVETLIFKVAWIIRIMLCAYF